MTRRDILQEIMDKMGEEGVSVPEPTEDFCQGCGSVIESDPFINSVVEHGSDEEYEVMYCDESCKDAHIQEMFERDPESL